MPLAPWLPILSALLCLYLATNLSVATWLRFLVWLVVGLVIYAAYGRRHARIATPDAALTPASGPGAPTMR